MNKKGEYILFTREEYDDFGTCGVYKCLKDFHKKKELERFLDKYPKQTEYAGFEPYDFIKFLIEKKVLEEIKYDTIHLGNYNEIPIFRED